MISTELINYIKDEITKGHSNDTIKQTLIMGGEWTEVDIKEAFRALSSVVMPTTPDAHKGSNKSLWIIAIILLGALAFAGWYFFRAEVENIFGIQAVDEVIEKESDVATIEKIIYGKEYLQTDSIKLLYPPVGEKIQSGSDIEVKYEVLKDIPSDVFVFIVMPSVDCKPLELSNKPKVKGIYTTTCKNFGIDNVGESVISINEFSDEVKDPAEGKLTFFLSKDTKPLEIVMSERDLEYTVGVMVYLGPYDGHEDTVYEGFILPKIKFSDGIERSVPLKEFNYSVDDPSLVRFSEYTNITGLFHANKAGTTVLHLEYEGLKKDVIINTIPDRYAKQKQ